MTSAASVPRTLHHVWLGPHAIPPEFLEWRERWHHLHPSWRYRLWTDEDVPANVRALANRAKSIASAANVIRLHALLTEGGVYADLDFEWNHPLDPLMGCEAFAARDLNGTYCNALMACIPQHPVWVWMWEQIPERVTRKPPWGPRLLTDAIERDPARVVSLPPRTFYPYRWSDEKRPASDFPESIAVHHWERSWR